MSTRISFKLSYNGGSAENGELYIYEAGESLRGLSRALAITTHAFVNEGEVRIRASRIRGADILLSAPQRGSFIQSVGIVFSDPLVQTIGASVISAAFYDFTTWAWSAAAGMRIPDPETPFVQRLEARKEPILGELAAGLESAFAGIHSPIARERQMTISMIRPRVGEIIRLDKDSQAFVQSSTEEAITEGIIGNVTKYNLLSGFGRFYDDDEERTISFNLLPTMPQNQKRSLTWSMHQRSRDLAGKLSISAKRVLTAHGEPITFTAFIREAGDQRDLTRSTKVGEFALKRSPSPLQHALWRLRALVATWVHSSDAQDLLVPIGLSALAIIWCAWEIISALIPLQYWT